MKTYIKPEIEILILNVGDIIMLSAPSTDLGDVEEKPGDTGMNWGDF